MTMFTLRQIVGCVMRPVPVQTPSSAAIRLAVAGIAVAFLAGCSADATRFAENPFGTDPAPTASIPSSYEGGSGYGGAPVAPVTSQPLAPAMPAPAATPARGYAVPARPSPQASYHAPAAEPVITGAISRGTGGWSAEGGTPIVVAQGESASMLATRYGVPTDVLLRTNGFTSATQVQPGARLVIPVYGARASTSAPTTVAPSRTAGTPARVLPTRPTVKPSGQLSSAEKLQFMKGAESAAAKPAAPARLAKVAPAAAPVAPVRTTEVTKPVAKPGKQVAEAAPAKVAPTRSAIAAQQVDRETTTASVAAEPASTASDTDKPEFRWPARGHIIQGFKAGGNDGINIALPEGTSIKAAEAGVVAYAGNELKGYGNLVLIRHPNGFVSAYANNGEISVKRGDNVKRGQLIAKSGQTGNVASPQLHFELRKGSTPVDPTNYLAGL